MSSQSSAVPSTGVVIFGATGDLVKRKLIPAFFNLYRDKLLPESFFILGVSRAPLSDDDFRVRLAGAVAEHSRRAIETDKAEWRAFSKRIHYLPLNFGESQDFSSLKKTIDDLATQHGLAAKNLLFYLATDPQFFASIAAGLKNAGLVSNEQPFSRLIVEKPFGKDLASAMQLSAAITNNFAEQQIFRIDHYLGKEVVQNIMVLRFANGIFEPLWNHKYISHIEITVAETVGVETRAGYFDQTGILRDIVQNHVLQILALVCIEPPANFSAQAIRDEKVKVLRSLRPITPSEVGTYVVRGQYDEGLIDGAPVSSYQAEKGVGEGSATETYVAMECRIDNWRWFGVPIYVRAGKRLKERKTEINVYFKEAPIAAFKPAERQQVRQNVLTIKVQPNEGIVLGVNSKPPGLKLAVSPVELDFSYGRSFGDSLPEAYERLLLDVIKGDATLFIRSDEIEEAWRYLEPILGVWGGSEDATQLYPYAAGTSGPVAASQLAFRNGHQLSEP